ncbi:helicase C-terminal domain-containing protein [Streptomyces sp. NPDC048155]|uniref:helicase C-terminal domain-containing protein n=1 Tax=Streptomyces sp. NPDC048155 TaxID=3154818 RepID=UPI0033C1912D
MSDGSALAAWLRGPDNPSLERVLAAREDAASAPEPRTVGELADRLQRPGSVALALHRLPLPCFQVAEALAAVQPPASRTALGDLLGATDEESARELDSVLETLADHALVWPDGNGLLRMAAPLRQVWDAPLGLDVPLEALLAGATSEELRGMLAALGITPPGTKQQRLAALVGHHSDPERIVAVAQKAPPATRKLLERRSGSPSRHPGGTSFGALGTESEPGARWALDRGLLIQDRHRYGPARMPSEVAVALRGPGWHAPFDPAPPVPPLVTVTSEEVHREAAAAATAFAAHAASVLSACAASPPARLKSGGVGARELARICKAAHCDEAVVRIILETAHAAGLLAHDADHFSATQAYDTWAGREPAERLPLLLQAWWTLALTPSCARDEDGRAQPTLTGALPCDGCVQARHGLLAAATSVPAGQGVVRAQDLGPLVAWCRPFADQTPQDTQPFATVIRESELLGVLARGALSPLGAALLTAGSDAANDLTTVCHELLPKSVGTARIGGDLTAVVTGTPSAGLTTLLDSVADRETGGTASVWRFSAATVRRALDSGRTPEDITAELAAIASGPLPQPLTYLITDTARSHGRVRVAPATCVIHSPEPALLAELAAHRKFAGLGLRQLAPTVLISRTPLDKTLTALRAEGYAPMAETADGTVRIERPTHRRATVPVPAPRTPGRAARARRSGARADQTPVPVDLAALAARLRAAPVSSPEPDPYNGGIPFDTDTEEIIAGNARRLSLTDVRQLAHAVDDSRAITIEYVATSGSRTIRTLSRLDLDPPYLNAWCHLRNDERVFTLSRIHGVMPA